MIQSNDLLQNNSLQSFFFDLLLTINRKMTCRIPQELLYYSSTVLDKMSLAENYFETSNGKTTEKVLGLRLLEVQDQSIALKKRTYKEVADTSLMLCGYFHSSVNVKIVDHSYYQMLGESSYRKLGTLVSTFLNIDNFFEILAMNFVSLSNVLSALADEVMINQSEDRYIVKVS